LPDDDFVDHELFQGQPLPYLDAGGSVHAWFAFIAHLRTIVERKVLARERFILDKLISMSFGCFYQDAGSCYSHSTTTNVANLNALLILVANATSVVAKSQCLLMTLLQM
jgi:hypothetical protein